MVTIQSKQVAVTDALRSFAEKQTAHITKFGKKVQNISFFLETVSRKKNDPKANKVVVTVAQPGKDVVVRSFGVDLYQTIADAAKAAGRRLRKVADKKTDLRRGQVDHPTK